MTEHAEVCDPAGAGQPRQPRQPGHRGQGEQELPRRLHHRQVLQRRVSGWGDNHQHIDNNNPRDPRQRQQQGGPVSGVRQLLHGGRLRGRILRGGAYVDNQIFLFGLLNIFPPKGFGVCCLFFTSSCGDTVTQNISYLQNPGYPSGYSTAASTQCDYNVRKVDTSPS